MLQVMLQLLKLSLNTESLLLEFIEGLPYPLNIVGTIIVG